jgi:hypothetical protein
MATGFRPEDFARLEGGTAPGDLASALLQTDMDAREVANYLMVEGDGVEFVTSRIPNAGLGVCVTRNVPKGTLITKYEGILVTTQSLNGLRKLPALQRYRDALASHTFLVNWVVSVVANFRYASPTRGDYLTEKGWYPVLDPRTEMATKGLGGFLNSLYDGDEALVPDGYNVRFTTLCDKSVGTEFPTRPNATVGSDFIKRQASVLGPKSGRMFVVVEALRDIAADEELFVHYGRVEASDKPSLYLDPSFFVQS